MNIPASSLKGWDLDSTHTPYPVPLLRVSQFFSFSFHFFLFVQACSAFFQLKIYLIWDAFDLKFLIVSTNSLVVKMIRTPIPSDNNEAICSKR